MPRALWYAPVILVADEGGDGRSMVSRHPVRDLVYLPLLKAIET